MAITQDYDSTQSDHDLQEYSLKQDKTSFLKLISLDQVSSKAIAMKVEQLYEKIVQKDK